MSEEMISELFFQPIDVLLDRLADERSAADALVAERDGLVASCIPVEVTEKIARVKETYSQALADRSAAIEQLESLVKEKAITGGVTVKGKSLMAVFLPGRVSWDTKMLQGLALAFPKIMDASKVGDPSASIQKLRGS